MKTFPSRVIGLLCVVASLSAHAQQSAGGGAVSISSASLVLSSNRTGGMLTVNNSKPVFYNGGAIGGVTNLTLYGQTSTGLNNLGVLNRTGIVPITLQSTTTSTGTGTTGSTFALTGNNNFTSGGSLTLSSGSVMGFTSNTTLASGSLSGVVNIGTSTLVSGSNSFVGSGLTLQMGSGSTISSSGLIKTGGATLLLNAGTLDLGTGSTLSSGVVTINNLGSFTGTTINGGSNNAVLTIGSGSVLVSGASTVTNGTITGTTGTLGGTLTLGGNNFNTGSGSLTLSGGINTYTGVTTINGGTLVLGSGATGTLGAGSLVISGTGTIVGLNSIAIFNGTLSAGAGPVNLTISGNGSMTMSLPSTVQINSISLPTSKQLTINVTAGTPLNKIPTIKENTATSLQTQAKFLDGFNTNGGGVSMLYLPAVQSLASDPFSVHLSELATAGTSEKFVLQMTFDPAAAAALGDLAKLYLAWYDPADSTWKNAIDGNSDGGASSQFVQGAYDPAVDSALGTYGVDTTNSTVWAVVDHDGTFAVANSDVQPGTSATPTAATSVQLVPEPSSAVLLACGLGLFARRRRKA